MPPKVDFSKCNGCGNAKESMCEMVCPGDLMVRDAETNKSSCRKSRDCWDCMSCVKACSRHAITLKIPYELGYYGAELIPEVGKGKIKWTCKDINGNVEVYEIPTRNNV